MSTTVVVPRVQLPTAQPSQPQQWYPGPLDASGELDRSMLDVAFKTVFSQAYSLQQTSVQSPTGTSGAAMASGALLVTGSLKAIASGLSTVSNVVVSVDAGSVATNLWVSATPSTTVPGAFDVYVWQPTSASVNTPTACTTPTIVRWHAYGTQ